MNFRRNRFTFAHTNQKHCIMNYSTFDTHTIRLHSMHTPLRSDTNLFVLALHFLHILLAYISFNYYLVSKIIDCTKLITH